MAKANKDLTPYNGSIYEIKSFGRQIGDKCEVCGLNEECMIDCIGVQDWEHENEVDCIDGHYYKLKGDD